MGQTNTIDNKQVLLSTKTSEVSQRKKMNPLKYIEPINFHNEDLPQTCNFDAGLSKKFVDDVQEATHGLKAEDEVGECLSMAEDVIECDDGDEQKDSQKKIANIVKVKWNKFIKMKNRNFQDDYRIVS